MAAAVRNVSTHRPVAPDNLIDGGTNMLTCVDREIDCMTLCFVVVNAENVPYRGDRINCICDLS